MKPRLDAMLQQRAAFDEEINKVLVFLAPNKDHTPVGVGERAQAFVLARLARARTALDRFEDACRG